MTKEPSLFGHAGHGQLHIRPFLDLANSNDVRKIESLAERLYEDVWELGGTISGEHGDGLSRTAYVAKQYGPLAEAFREVKTQPVRATAVPPVARTTKNLGCAPFSASPRVKRHPPEPKPTLLEAFSLARYLAALFWRMPASKLQICVCTATCVVLNALLMSIFRN